MRISDWSSDVCSSDLPARRSAQRVEEPCGSASTRTVCCPESADCAARWVAIVVLPTPPLELATNTVFMRFLRTDETIREGTPARGRPRPHSLDACPRLSFILSRGTDGAGRGLGRGSELRSAARGKRHGMRERSEEHTSELQSLMRISYAVFCLNKKTERKKT